MSDDAPVRDGGFDDFLDALESGEGYYLAGDDGRGWLPPRSVDPRTGATDLDERPLPETGTIETYTVIRVPTPRFADDAPFALAVVDLGPVKLTGQVHGIDLDAIDIGLEVSPRVEQRDTDRLIVFEPTDGDIA